MSFLQDAYHNIPIGLPNSSKDFAQGYYGSPQPYRNINMSSGKNLTGATSRAMSFTPDVGAHDSFLEKKMRSRSRKVWAGRGKMIGGAALKTASLAGSGVSGLYRAATSPAANKSYKAANAFSKLAFGASIPQIGAVAGAGLLAYGMLSDDPVGGLQAAAQGASAMRSEMKSYTQQFKRSSYRSTEFQQSTQGLVFGLHGSRTR